MLTAQILKVTSLVTNQYYSGIVKFLGLEWYSKFVLRLCPRTSFVAITLTEIFRDQGHAGSLGVWKL